MPAPTPPRPSSSRRRVGQLAEEAVADFLHTRGFRVLARNLRLGALELDLVGQRGGLVVVVEVRTRGAGAFESPFASIGPTKRVRLREAVARLWRRQLAGMADVERVRLDVAAVWFEGGRTWVEYVEGAIGPG